MLEKQTHPYKPYIPDNAKGVIIGSAPPHQFCTDKGPDLKEGDINFFYGSVRNQFWCVMKHTLNQSDYRWPRAQ